MQLIIAEKPSAGKAILSLPLDIKQLDVIYTYAYGFFKSKANKIGFNDIPTTPELSEDTMRERYLTTPIMWIDQGIRKKGLAEDILSTISARIAQYSEIIIATDNDAIGDYSASQIITALNGVDMRRVTRAPVVSMSAKGMLDTYNKRTSYDASATKVRTSQQRVKRIFDHWWKINSEVVLGEACSKVGMKGNPAVSKYELMLYYFLATAKDPLSAEYLLDWMGNPQPRKDYPDNIKRNATIGSPVSRVEIINQANARGALSEFIVPATSKRVAHKAYRLSDAGQQFLNLMHPKTQDHDLPFRLYNWMILGGEDQDGAMQQIRRYINTLFGRQLRFQRKQW
jgi:5S rRNA maturation endonuclease (ribonuclease M5)